MSDLQEHVVPFTAGDGMRLNLIHVRGKAEANRGAVLLVHGAGVRANIFRAPVDETLVDALIADGWDVWLENWRASIDVTANPWTLDQAALHDHPAAVDAVLRETRSNCLKAVIHCQGSTSFTMSAVAGLLPGVDTIVSNAVSLHPVVPTWSRVKLNTLAPAARVVSPYVSPGWGVDAPTVMAKLFASVARISHRECDNDVCKLVSLIYGAGHPALWRHENLNDETHEWLKREFGPVPLRFHAQMARCVAKGHLVGVERLVGLPSDFTVEAPRTDARWVFLAGDCNLCFLPESQSRSYEYFRKTTRGAHTLHRFPAYGHLDIFMGKNASRDVFPIILRELSTPPFDASAVDTSQENPS